MTTLVTLETAQSVYAQLVAGVPELPAPKLGYPQDSPVGPAGEREYHIVWENNGYYPLISVLQDQMENYGQWPQMVSDEYAASAGHQPASQYGLSEGITWVFVKTSSV